jgi:hypothetical protein
MQDELWFEMPSSRAEVACQDQNSGVGSDISKSNFTTIVRDGLFDVSVSRRMYESAVSRRKSASEKEQKTCAAQPATDIFALVSLSRDAALACRFILILNPAVVDSTAKDHSGTCRNDAISTRPVNGGKIVTAPPIHCEHGALRFPTSNPRTLLRCAGSETMSLFAGLNLGRVEERDI